MRPFTTTTTATTLLARIALLSCLAPACSSSGAVAAATDGGVDSAPIDAGPFDCAVSETSSLPGVAIHFTTSNCTFSLAQAAAGLRIPYEVTIDRDLTDVVLTPDTQDGSRRTGPGASGLAIFEMLSGGDQRYCLCDTGFPSPPDSTARQLKKGTYPLAFQWDGVNWNGPSDTFAPKGKPFPAGVYRLEIRASGTAPAPGGSAPFHVQAAMNVRLVP